MAIFRYPQNDLNSSDLLLNLLGSFWANTYQGNQLVQELTQVTGQAAQQTYLQLLELVNSVSRFSVPIFHKENWHAITILESEINTSLDLINKYGDGIPYQSSGLINYGDLNVSDLYAINKPAGLTSANVILNRLTTPSVEYLNNIDFTITDNLILFRENPFTNSKIAKTEKLNNLGEVIDRECVLWVYNGLFDLDSVYTQFGYALNLKLQSSEGYKEFINAILDALVEGTSKRSQQLALAAAFGVPVVMEATETIQNIITTDVLNIITDAHVYQYPLTVSPIVSVGDTVYAGDSLTDVFQIFELNRGGSDITEQEISALSIENGVLGSGYLSNLIFENTDKPLIVQLDVDGYTKVSWDLGGFPYDVEKFWDDVHTNGIIKNQTLAMLLDVRENPDTQPLASSLPSTVNPFQFLTDNFLRNNAFIVKVKGGTVFSNKLEYIPIAQFRKITPPHTLMILVVELLYQDSPIILEGAGSSLSTGYVESLSGFPCMAINETIESSSISERIRTTQIGGRCI